MLLKVSTSDACLPQLYFGCTSAQIIKNGRIHTGKQRFKCRACGRQFVEDSANPPMAQSTRDLIDKLLLECFSLTTIVRLTGVSERWLQPYVNQKYSPTQAR